MKGWVDDGYRGMNVERRSEGQSRVKAHFDIVTL